MSNDELILIARQIADKLGETLPQPRRLVEQIVMLCGAEFAQQMLEETMDVEAKGGLMIESGERRRTTGGVFFYLVRNRIPEEIRAKIFLQRWGKRKNGGKPFLSTKERLKLEQEREARHPKFEWETRVDALRSLRAKKKRGEVHTVNVTLTGRPGPIERREYLVITTMTDDFNRMPQLPKGIPLPPSMPTTYQVYISSRQWQQVEKALNDSSMGVVIDGVLSYDPEGEGFAVLAVSVKARKLKPPQRPEGEGEAAVAQSEPEAAGETEAKPKKQKKPKEPAAAAPPPALPEIEVIIPPNAPAPVAAKLKELYMGASTLRQRLASLQAKPANQRFGLEMTQKLLKTTEDQIAAILQKYS